MVLDAEEGRRIAECLGRKKALILANHGLLTAGATIEEVVAWFILLEKVCHNQLVADASAAGSGVPLVEIGHAEAQSTFEALGHSKAGYCKPTDSPQYSPFKSTHNTSQVRIPGMKMVFLANPESNILTTSKSWAYRDSKSPSATS